uniref:Retrotransposon protein, putative, Ty1-copia subclass n=1 Tax=Tanacetum cinerariifolium TaxID=118510 RepID=A0A6L2PBK5_TANCI|nr:hypothetical protein [Tanacetum cinerariifolium]
MQNIPYASTVGSIMYAVRCTRPDVVFAQNITSRLQQNPGDAHWTAVKNILKYLHNTKDMFLVYEGNTKQELRVSCYTDAGYLTDVDDIKSQTRYVFVLNGGCMDSLIHFGLGVVPTIEEPINMYRDNTGSIAIAKDHGVTKGARHFRAKVHYLRKTIEMGDVKIEKVDTDDNLADPFTKALAFPKQSKFTEKIRMMPARSLISWFRWISFDYRVPLGFGSIAGGLDHVNLVTRLPLEHGISRILGLGDHPNPSVGTNPEKINDGPNNVDAIQASFKGAHLTKEYPFEKEDKTEDEGDMDVSWDITVKDVKRLRQFLTPTIHTLPNPEPVAKPYMPFGPVYDKEKIIREEEQNYDIPLHDGVMQPLAPQTVHIIPPDDYVAPATNLILDKQLNEFRKEFSNITGVAKKENFNTANDVCELSGIKKYDCETFIKKLLHQVSQSSTKPGRQKWK